MQPARACSGSFASAHLQAEQCATGFAHAALEIDPENPHAGSSASRELMIGLQFRKLNLVMIIRKPCYVLYTHIMVN